MLGDIEIQERLAYSSNNAFIVSVNYHDKSELCVYKPEAGERPLWDFEPGLWKREVGAYELSALFGWDIIPETVERFDAPLGVGSIQKYIDFDPKEHYFTLIDQEKYLCEIEKVALFDFVANNADRKGGHFLIDGNGHLWAIDHGLCFNEEPKLRTVVWDLGERRVPNNLKEDLIMAKPNVEQTLEPYLNEREIQLTMLRLDAVLKLEVFPDPGDGRRPYPWPLL